MTTSKVQKASYYRAIQLLTVAISLAFIAIIAYGYYHVFMNVGAVTSFIIAMVLALAAWLCAKVIGTAPESSKAMLAVVYVPLLVISATGVFSSMMLYVEGSKIVADTANDSQNRFDQLSGTAEAALAQTGAANRINKVRTLKDALISEIRNTANCGQGPSARSIIADIQRELPGFVPLSNPSGDCTRNEDLVSDYNQKIDALIDRANWNNPDIVKVIRDSAASREVLAQLRTDATTNYSPSLIQSAINTLEAQDTAYRSLRNRLSRHVGVQKLADGLDSEAVQSLGSGLKLFTLLTKRIYVLNTWIYLFLAVGIDLFMVHLFRINRKHRVNPNGPQELLQGGY